MDFSYTLKYEAGGKFFSLENTAQNDDFSLAFTDLPHRHTVRIRANRDLFLRDFRESSLSFFPARGKKPAKDDLYFLNGYQSWTDTRETYPREREKDLSRLPRFLIDAFAFDRYGDALFYDYKKEELHGYDLFYAKGSRECFVASLNEKSAYLIARINRKTGELTLAADVDGREMKAGEEFTLCDYLYYENYESGVPALRRHYGERKTGKIFGYTSWYNYYQNINEEILLRDLDALDDRFQLFQIDDGFETFVGDWMDVDAKKFPRGLSPIVERAHQKGFLAGIWLAPFVAEEKSRLFREKSHLFKRDDSGSFVKCGSNWSSFYALDLENEKARDYISSCLKAYAEMGFDFFKLDFLYGANLPRYEGKTRCEAATRAYAFLRESLGDKIILGCGATPGNARGVFDYLRVGPDVSLKFDDLWYMRFMHRERISTKVTLQNTVYRSFLNGIYFGNDPDVFLLRDGNNYLSEAPREALITVNALFGSVLMTSDNLGRYDDKKRETLARALDLFENARVLSFERKGKAIRIVYSLRGETREILYLTEKGVLTHG